MRREESNKARQGTTSIHNPKSKGFARKISHSAAIHYKQQASLGSYKFKTLLRKHSEAIAFFREQEQASLNNMISEIGLLKTGELK